MSIIYDSERKKTYKHSFPNLNEQNYNNLLFVQVWPGSWLHKYEINYNFTNDYFTIHGIWPENYDGSYPQYCNKTIHFNYNKIKYIENNLTKYWTDFKNPKRFLRHEFDKHFTCIESNNIYEYFWLGLKKRTELDIYNILKKNNVIPNNNIKYDINNIKKILYSILLYEPIITCKNNILTEIIFCSDNNLNLIDCPKPQRKMECRDEKIWYNII